MNWGKVKVGDCCEVTSSKRIFFSEYVDSGVPFYRSKEIIESSNGQAISEPLFISQEKYDEIKNHFGVPQPGDMLLTSVGTIGVPYIVREKDYFYFKDGNLTWFRNFSDALDSKYLYFWVKSSEGQSVLNNTTIGSSQKALTIASLKGLEIPCPPAPVQKRIVEILAGYDALIENNQKQIKLLEEAAQRLYKEWFVDLRFPGHTTTPIVDGVPEGWTSMAMNDIAEYINGYAFKPSDWGTKGKPIIKIKEMGSGITADTPRNRGEGIPAKYIVTAGDILFSWSATLSAMIWDEEDGLLNQHLFKVIPHNGISREFILQSILKALDEFSNLTTGSTTKHIQRGKLKEVFVNVPDNATMRKYESISEPMREQILTLKKQIILLKEARDRLLPKLMNGEIEV